MKQTAVKWLQEQLSKILIDNQIQQTNHLFEQAEEMEKEQIIDARVTSPLLDTCNKNAYIIEAEQYYNETFKNK